MGTVATKRPPTVLFRDSQLEVEGQQLSPGRQWQLLAATAWEVRAAIAARVQEVFILRGEIERELTEALDGDDPCRGRLLICDGTAGRISCHQEAIQASSDMFPKCVKSRSDSGYFSRRGLAGDWVDIRLIGRTWTSDGVVDSEGLAS